MNISILTGIILAVFAAGLGFLLSADAPLSIRVSVFLAILLWTIIASAIETPKQRQSLRSFAKFAALPYQATIDRLMVALPRSLLPSTVAAQPPPKSGILSRVKYWTIPRARDGADLIRLMNNPWSWPVIDAALRVALLYPILFLVGQWTLATGRTGLGAMPLLAHDIPGWLRWATFGLIASLMTTRILALITAKGVFEKLSLWLMLGALAVAFAGAVLAAVMFAGAFADASLFEINVAYTFLLAGVFGGAVAFAFAVAGASAAAGAVAVAFAGAAAFEITFAGVFAGAVAGVFAGAVAGAYTLVTMTAKLSARGSGCFGYVILVGTLLGFSIWAAVIAPKNSDIEFLIIPLALFPVLNSIFDWLSYGTTIYLLAKGRREGGLWPIVCGVADAIAAAVILFALGLTLTGVLALINALRMDPFVDLPALLTGLRDTPFENYWLIAMGASTLVPTLFHLCLGFVSLVTLVREHVWMALVGKLSPDETAQTSLGATTAILGILVAYVTLPIGLIYYALRALWHYGGHLRTFYADSWLTIANGLNWI